MIKVTVEFPTAEDAIEGLARLRGVAGVAGISKPDPKPETTKAPGKPAATAKPADTPATAKDTPAAAAETKPAASSAASTASAYDPVKAAISAAAKTNRPAVVATLTKFDAKAGTDLKPEQYDAFMVELAAALAPPADDLG